ncbi:MAG: hypothetical protein JSU03_04975, partial [Bacteroidetes bacterium]|nr:hypothetical protein [Bacteroidota bacterium]
DKIENKGKTKKVDYIGSEDSKYIYGIKYVTFPEKQINIAWNVVTLERLNAIYTSLTNNSLIKAL